jgi:hypothetical protein
MDRTLTNSSEDWAIHGGRSPAAMRHVRRRRHFVVALRSVLAVALLGLAMVAFNKFDEPFTYCAANWVMHPRTACWISAYGY